MRATCRRNVAGVIAAGVYALAAIAAPGTVHGSTCPATHRPLELETLVIDLKIPVGPRWAAEPSVAVSRPSFAWGFSETPIVVTNAVLAGEPRELFISAPRMTSREGAELVLTGSGGGFPSDHDDVLEVRINVLAVVPNERKNVLGGAEMLRHGEEITFPASFVELSKAHPPDVEPVVIVNAQGGGRPLKAAAVYEGRRSDNDYAVAEGFTVSILDHEGRPWEGQALVQWIAVLPGLQNPFRGYQARATWGQPFKFLGITTGTRPLIVSNAQVAGLPYLTGWDGTLDVPRGTRSPEFRLRYHDAAGIAIGYKENPVESARRTRGMRAQWSGVESFYSAHVSLARCTVEVLEDSKILNSVPWFLADVDSRWSQWADGEVSSGRRGYYTLIRIHGPPDQTLCQGDLSFDVSAVGTIDRWSSQPSPVGAAVGQYKAEIKTGVVEASSSDWPGGLLTSLWQTATDPGEEFLNDVKEIVVGELPGFAVGGMVIGKGAGKVAGILAGKVPGLTIGASTDLLESAQDAVTCDEQIHRMERVTFTDAPFCRGGRYKVFVFVEGDARMGSFSWLGLAGGFTEIDFEGREPNQCDAGSSTYGANKKLSISNIRFTQGGQDPPAIQRQPDRIVSDSEAATPPPGQETANVPPPTAMLRIQALNDRPGPVKLQVWGIDPAGTVTVDTVVEWSAADNRYSTESIEIPAATSVVRLTFVNDFWRAAGGPDMDRNAFIDYVEWGGERFEAEGFEHTGGRPGQGAGCGRREEPGRSDGLVAGCGNGGDFIELRLSGRPER